MLFTIPPLFSTKSEMPILSFCSNMTFHLIFHFLSFILILPAHVMTRRMMIRRSFYLANLSRTLDPRRRPSRSILSTCLYIPVLGQVDQQVIQLSDQLLLSLLPLSLSICRRRWSLCCQENRTPESPPSPSWVRLMKTRAGFTTSN